MNEGIVVLIIIIFMILVGYISHKIDRCHKPDENEEKEWEIKCLTKFV